MGGGLAGQRAVSGWPGAATNTLVTLALAASILLLCACQTQPGFIYAVFVILRL